MQYTRRLSCFERNPETYLKTVTEYKPVDFQPSAFSLAEGRFFVVSIANRPVGIEQEPDPEPRMDRITIYHNNEF